MVIYGGKSMGKTNKDRFLRADANVEEMINDFGEMYADNALQKSILMLGLKNFLEKEIETEKPILSEADRIFEELDYKKTETKTYIRYSKDYATHKATIEFNLEDKTVETNIENKHMKEFNVWQSFNGKKIKAILLKCEELGFEC